MQFKSSSSQPVLDKPVTVSLAADRLNNTDKLNTDKLNNVDVSPADHDTHRDYSHILVPTEMSPRELPALQLGLQIAAASKAPLTLLHVLPNDMVAPTGAERSSSMHWLEAIDNLHEAMSPERNARTRDRVKLIEETRLKLAAYLKQHVPNRLRDQVEIRFECTLGDTTDEIVRFAEMRSVDLLVMTSGLSHWRLPFAPARVHRVLQRVHSRVLVVRPNAKDKKAKKQLVRAHA